ncbi:MAG: nuclear transport factor 2 family protein [Gammaproteobacteria bacterium]
MRQPPAIATLTPAPLRNRIRAELDAPTTEVWALIGDLARFPEFSAGLERVDLTLDADGRCTEYVCHFKPVAAGQPGIVHREIMRWHAPGRGYASSAAAGNAFGLTDNVNLVTIEPSPGGTLLTWDEYFESRDVESNQASYDQALGDIADRLITRFGGRMIERFIRDTRTAAGPAATVARLTDAVNRGDLDAATALYEPEAVLVGQPGNAARGHERIREALSGFIRLRPTLITTASHALEVGDLALYLGGWCLAGIGQDGAPVTMRGESADVLRRHPNGRWLIVLDDPWGTALLPAA